MCIIAERESVTCLHRLHCSSNWKNIVWSVHLKLCLSEDYRRWNSTIWTIRGSLYTAVC